MKDSKRKRLGLAQVRPKGGQDQRWYAPDRDLTVFYPALLRQTFEILKQPASGLDQPLIDVWTALDVSDDEMVLMARTFAKIIRCVIARGEDLREVLERSGFQSHRAQAIIGMVFLRLVTEHFVTCYGQTLHKGEHDPNHRDLKDCEALLAQFARFAESEDDDQE